MVPDTVEETKVVEKIPHGVPALFKQIGLTIRTLLDVSTSPPSPSSTLCEAKDEGCRASVRATTIHVAARGRAVPDGGAVGSAAVRGGEPRRRRRRKRELCVSRRMVWAWKWARRQLRYVFVKRPPPVNNSDRHVGKDEGRPCGMTRSRHPFCW